MKRIATSLRHRRKVNHRSALNGSHGEFTDTDDLKKSQGSRAGQQKNNATRKRRQAQQLNRRIPRAPRNRMDCSMSAMAGGGPRGQVALSKCAAKFLLAQTDPFSKDAIGACIPVPGSRASLRVTSIVRGTVSTGTNGCGYLSVHPTVAKDAVHYIYSKPTYTAAADAQPTVLTANNTLTVGLDVGTAPSLPYSVTQLITGLATNTQVIEGRLVGGAIRLFSTSAKMYESGMVNITANPMHANVGAQVSVGGGLSPTANQYCRTFMPGEDMVIPFGPNNALETQYVSNQETPNPNNVACYPLSHGDNALTHSNYTYAAGGINCGAAPIVVWITGALLANPTTYCFEIVQHIEYAGIQADAQGIPVESDAVGVQRVQSAISETHLSQLRNPHTKKPQKSLTQIALGALKETAKEAIPVVISSLAASLPALLL